MLQSRWMVVYSFSLVFLEDFLLLFVAFFVSCCEVVLLLFPVEDTGTFVFPDVEEESEVLLSVESVLSNASLETVSVTGSVPLLIVKVSFFSSPLINVVFSGMLCEITIPISFFGSYL